MMNGVKTMYCKNCFIFFKLNALNPNKGQEIIIIINILKALVRGTRDKMNFLKNPIFLELPFQFQKGTEIFYRVKGSSKG